ncbi:PQQ-binding-like beta-propeller repeat protein [Sandaracinus amylolyticus]|uniref:PQQ-binding-like beta-propeller repeat protein n=1 Tax=Sandaracinus amylolyticus TaxID=927083 RepID=UPI001F1668DD|nr:PQQ-binding-like beta-propeller repeat protein [Sandaracinus amylolyticus]UJR82998.1 Hypothetical protein I5071_50630 [Sandaracinus amylolyticus]
MRPATLMIGVTLWASIGCASEGDGFIDAGDRPSDAQPSIDASEPSHDASEPSHDAPTLLDARIAPDAAPGCGPGETMCGAACADTRNDPAHCGACDEACPSRDHASPTCRGSSCSFVCDAGWADCDANATNGCETSLAADPSNCGACGTVCPPGAGLPGACIDRACGIACPTGSADCNDFRGDGCEVATAADPANCGGCGVACGDGEACREGVCRPRFVWSRRLGGTGNDSAAWIDADLAGNAYVAGVYTPPVDLGGGPVTASASGTNYYLASYDATGTHRWSRDIAVVRTGVSGMMSGIAVAADRVFAAGRVSVGSRAVLVASYDAVTGAPGWTLDVDTTASADVVIRAIATDPTGTVLVTGELEGTYDLGGGPVTAAMTGYGAFVAAYDGATGAHRWSRAFTAGRPQAITSDDAGNVYVAGSTTYHADLGAGPSPGTASPRLWIASYDPTGAYRWARLSAGDCSGTRIASNGSDALYLMGSFDTSIDVGGGALSSAGLTDIVVAGFDASTGAHRWSRRAGSGSREDVWGGTLDRTTGVLTLTGSFDGLTDFGGGVQLSACCYALGMPYTDAFLASYDAAGGAFVWANQYGEADSDSGRAVTAAGGALYFVGSFRRGVSFGSGGELLTTGGTDGFVAVANPSP